LQRNDQSHLLTGSKINLNNSIRYEEVSFPYGFIAKLIHMVDVGRVIVAGDKITIWRAIIHNGPECII